MCGVERRHWKDVAAPKPRHASSVTHACHPIVEQPRDPEVLGDLHQVDTRLAVAGEPNHENSMTGVLDPGVFGDRSRASVAGAGEAWSPRHESSPTDTKAYHVWTEWTRTISSACSERRRDAQVSVLDANAIDVSQGCHTTVTTSRQTRSSKVRAVEVQLRPPPQIEGRRASARAAFGVVGCRESFGGARLGAPGTRVAELVRQQRALVPLAPEALRARTRVASRRSRSLAAQGDGQRRGVHVHPRELAAVLKPQAGGPPLRQRPFSLGAWCRRPGGASLRGGTKGPVAGPGAGVRWQ